MSSGLLPKSVARCWKTVFLVIGLPTAVVPVLALAQLTDTPPSYSAASIVNSATQTAGPLAPNTLATLYGSNLAFDTVAASTMSGGTLPTSLAGVSLSVNNITAPLLFVSPGQINFIVPYELLPGMVTVYVARQNLAGPVVTIQLKATAPGLFPWDGDEAIAIHLNGTLISSSAPAHAGEIVVIYADGLGRTSPDTTSGRIAGSATPIAATAQTQVLLNGVACPAASLLYAGLAPGFAGLYQINLILPDPVPVNPQIQIAIIGSGISPGPIQLAAQ